MRVHIRIYRTSAVAADGLGCSRAVCTRLVDAVGIDGAFHMFIEVIQGYRFRFIFVCCSRALARSDICRCRCLLCRIALNTDILLVDCIRRLTIYSCRREEIFIGILYSGCRITVFILDSNRLASDVPALQETMCAGFSAIRISRIRIDSDQGIRMRRAFIGILQAILPRAIVGVVELSLFDGQLAAIVDGVVLVRRSKAGNLGVRDVVDACIEIRIGRNVAKEVLKVLASCRIRCCPRSRVRF